MKSARIIFAVLLVLLLAASGGFAQAKKLKAGFVYIGPVGDSGWTFAHDQGRKYAMSKLPWLETVFVESVPEGDSTRILDRLVQEEKCDVVLTTSFGYMDDTIKAGERYPKTLFMHCSGFKNLPNVGTYFAELYQMYYLERPDGRGPDQDRQGRLRRRLPHPRRWCAT